MTAKVSARARYQALVLVALRDAGIEQAIKTGQPSTLTAKVKSPDASDVVVLDLDFSPYETEKQRDDSAFVAAQSAVEKLEEIALRERKKVARCPACSAWFETFAARNEHRDTEHRAKANGEPAADAVVKLEPHASSARVTGGSLVEW